MVLARGSIRTIKEMLPAWIVFDGMSGWTGTVFLKRKVSKIPSHGKRSNSFCRLTSEI